MITSNESKILITNQKYAQHLSSIARWIMFETPSPDIQAAIYFQEKSAAEYLACRIAYKNTMQHPQI